MSEEQKLSLRVETDVVVALATFGERLKSSESDLAEIKADVKALRSEQSVERDSLVRKDDGIYKLLCAMVFGSATLTMTAVAYKLLSSMGL